MYYNATKNICVFNDKSVSNIIRKINRVHFHKIYTYIFMNFHFKILIRSESGLVPDITIELNFTSIYYI